MTAEEKADDLKKYLKNGYGKFNDVQSELISLIICEQVLHQLKVCKSSTNDVQSINERINFFNQVEAELKK